ncbi:MAG: HD domain-containing protein [Candidatus Coprovivens sp.]
MYSKIEEAIYFVVKAYKGQRIKIENIDKCYHPMVVGTTIKDITNVEDIVVAAFLHDVIVDTEYGYEEIEMKFGTLVADIVQDLSEDMSISKWLDRKKDLIKRLRNNFDINVINIVIADKIHELVILYDAFLKQGDKVWKNTSGNKDENCWLYREIYNIGKNAKANSKLLKRYNDLLVMYFGENDG